EVEPGHFNPVYLQYSKQFGMDPKSLEEAYKSGKVKSAELDEYFVHDRCMRESGHDTSYRLENRCANLTTVDLNSLLYRIETDIAEILTSEFNGSLKTNDGNMQTASGWTARAAKRKELVNKYLWNEQQGMYFDYDAAKQAQTGYVAATTFYPLYA